MALELRKALVECAEVIDPSRDLSPLLGELQRELGRRGLAMAGVAPRRKAGGRVERQVHATQVDQQPEVLDVLVAIIPIPVLLARGGR